jgi:acetylornithine deacetylase/succinyl-diaminopimelate desuccinylase-like protein
MGLATQSLTYAGSNRSRFVEELKEFVRFPSVSAQPQHARDVARCAGWLAEQLRRAGLEKVRVVATERHPLVRAEWRHLPRRPTVLIYGHYDVQPADPLQEWQSPPFDPSVRDDRLFGRGACDDKGQLFAHVKAIESSLQTSRGLPVNVICLFEGEEEIGSPNLGAYLKQHSRSLAADVAVVSDTRILGPRRPAITYALRGGLGIELEVFGPGRDLHSGNFGGAIQNPIQALCELVAGLHEPEGRIAIPGIYDRVRVVRESDRRAMAQVAPSDAHILREARSAQGWGERGYSLYERTTIRPALTINGITGGYQGQGGKAVIPTRASAKLSFRLVPDQEPREIEQKLRRHLARVAPHATRVVVRATSAAKPVVIDRRHPMIRAAARAYRRGFGARPVFLRSGGTIPVVNHFQERLGIPTVLLGFALPDSRIHAPNENFHLPTFFRGIETCLWFLAEVGACKAAAAARNQFAGRSLAVEPRL